VGASQKQGRMMDNILFVFGAARGGTTFLSKILTQWFSYGMGPEGTFIKEIVEKAERLGDLSSNDKCYELAREIVNTQTFQIIETRWGEEEGFTVSPEEIIERMPERTVSSAIFAAYKVIAVKLNMQRVGNKNPGYWRELDTLNALFPQNARYLFIVRDGRDVALSLRDVPWGGHSVYVAATIWKNMIVTVREFEKRIKPGSLLAIRYEDLLSNPGETIESIGNFIGQKDMPEIRTKYEKAAKENELRSNYGKWHNNMSIEDQQVYEAIAGSALTEFGYERRFPHARLSYWRRSAYWVRELLRKIRVNIYHLQSHLPLDTRKSKKSKITKLVQPGNTNNSN
jgi:hypothetical protein